jgi:hypothetical protein
MEMVYVLWALYLLMMIVYGFGDRRWPTWVMFFGCLLWSLYLIAKLLRIVKIAPAIRYAIPTVIIFWISVEVLGRWGFFQEFWVEPLDHLLELGLIALAFVGAILLVRFLPDKERSRSQDSGDEAEAASKEGTA